MIIYWLIAFVVCLAHHCAKSPPGSYTQVIPSLEVSTRQIHRHGLPPSLPPQLLQVMFECFFLTFVRQNLLPSSSVCLQLFGFHFYYKCSCKAVFISYTNLSHYATYVIDVSLSAIISIELCIGVAI